MHKFTIQLLSCWWLCLY